VAYIGRPSIVGNFVKLDAITAVNGQAAYTMQNGSANFTDYSTVNQFLVSLNGTIQSPGSSFTVSGSTITFASNLVTNDVIDFIIVFGNSLSSGVPTDATVSTAKIVDDAITAAKINNDIISGATELASEPADTDEFLVSDAGTLKRIDYSHIKGGGITVADQFRITANKSFSAGVASDITANWERIDSTGQGTLGTGMTESSGVFTFPSTGIYLVSADLAFLSTGANSRYIETQIRVTTDNSNYNYVSRLNTAIYHIASNTYWCSSQQTLIDVTSTSNVKVMFRAESDQATTITGSTSHNEGNMFTFIRLGDT